MSLLWCGCALQRLFTFAKLGTLSSWFGIGNLTRRGKCITLCKSDLLFKMLMCVMNCLNLPYTPIVLGIENLKITILYVMV